MKRGGSPHTERPPPASLSCVPHSLTPFFEVFFFHLSISLSSISCPLVLTPNMPLPYKSVVIYSAAVLISVVQWGHV